MQEHTVPVARAGITDLLTLGREGAVLFPRQVFGLRGVNLLVRPCVATSRRLPVSWCHACSPIPLRVSSGFSPDSRLPYVVRWSEN